MSSRDSVRRDPFGRMGFGRSTGMNRAPRLRGGFTLIEVLIALAVIALALVALTRTASIEVRGFEQLRERNLAGWVAANVLTDTRLASNFPAIGLVDGRVRLADREWRWTREVQATANADVRRIDIRVFRDAEREPSATLSGFAGTALTP